MGYLLSPPNGSDVEVESEDRRDVLLARGYTVVEPEVEPEPAKPEPPKTDKK